MNKDYSGKRIMVGLSAGINSAAVLCWLATLPKNNRPDEIHLYYAHFKEHSPDSLKFVLDCVQYAKERFGKVIYKQTDNSIIEFFEKSKMIPHPAASPCSRVLKIEPMMRYMSENNLDLDLIGYVREEKGRATRMRKKHPKDSELKEFPLLEDSNEWCFEIVKQEIGWYPEIYDIRDEAGKRIFKHNNCLPCKNMHLKDFKQVEQHYPEYMTEAINLSGRLKKYWGRDKAQYYTEFGREDFEPEQCPVCAFD